LFKIEAGVCQGCVLAPDSFAKGMDWLLDRTIEFCSIGVAFCYNPLIWILLMMSAFARASCFHIGHDGM